MGRVSSIMSIEYIFFMDEVRLEESHLGPYIASLKFFCSKKNPQISMKDEDDICM